MGFETIYGGDLNENDEENDSERVNVGKKLSTTSKIFKRLSFSKNIPAESTAVHSNSAPILNTLVFEEPDQVMRGNKTECDGSVNRRPSSTGRLFKSLSFNLLSKNIADDKVVAGDVTSVDDSVGSLVNNISSPDNPIQDRRSSKMFRKLSFTLSS
jgi:hypothetical protein